MLTGERLSAGGRARALLLALGLLGAGATTLRAQEPVQLIKPEAKTPDSTARPTLPAEILQEVLSAYNDSLTTRIVGNLLLPAGSGLRGPLGVFRGSLRVAGEIQGPVTVINGDLIVDSGAVVRGDVLVVGGHIAVRPGGRLEGNRREFAAPAPLIRAATGLLIIRPPQRRLGDLATARASFRTGHFATTLSIATERTYNRVEGLPIVFGPSVVREGLPDVDARLDLRAVAWTAPDRTDRRGNFGYSGRLEFHFGAQRRLTVGGHVYRLIAPIEDHPLSRTEAGWSAFLLQRDYADYYQAEGVTGYASYALGHGLTVAASLRRDAERSVPAGDPISIFRNDAWRPNPLVDDGHYLSWRAGFDLDTRNEPEAPSSGWLVHGYLEQSRSKDAAPLSLPAEVRDPIPPGDYLSSRVWLDARRYTRFNQSIRTSVRLVAGGWIGGDPLPVQRRFSLGGPDLLPGYAFRSQNCAPAALADPSRPALCDRLVALQIETRTRTRVGLPIPSPDPYLTGLQRLFAIREPDIVVFADAGKAWVTGIGPGRVPNDRLPVLREWKYDIGFGVDAGGLGLYLAQPLTDGLPLTFTVRLQRRF